MIVNASKFDVQHATPPDSRPVNMFYSHSKVGNRIWSWKLCPKSSFQPIPVASLVLIHHKKNQTQAGKAEDRDFGAF